MRRLLQQGYSIIELMIALLLGSILLLGVTQMMITSSTLGTTTNNLLNNQDIARTTLDLLGSEARRAGYNGCNKISNGVLDVANLTDDDRYPVVPFIKEGKLGIKFRYGVDSNVGGTTGKKLSNTDCLGKDLYYRDMVYQNCKKDDGREGICITGGDKPADKSLVDDMIENVSLAKMEFTIFDIKNKQYKKLTIDKTSTIKVADIQASQSVTFYIDVTGIETDGVKGSSSNQVDRKYSSTYSLRNL